AQRQSARDLVREIRELKQSPEAPEGEHLSRGITAQDQPQVDQAINTAIAQGRAVADETMGKVLVAAKETLFDSGDIDGAGLLDITSFLFMLPAATKQIAVSPYYVYYESEQKFVLATIATNSAAIIPYQLITYLQDNGAPIQLIASIFLHEAKHIHHEFASEQEHDREAEAIIFEVRKYMLDILIANYAADNDSRLRDEIADILNASDRADTVPLLGAFPMLSIMNSEMPKAIEDGKVEVDAVMNIAQDRGTVALSQIQRDYQSSECVMLSNQRFKGAYPLPKERDLGTASAVYHLLDLYLNPKTGIAKESRHQEAIQEEKVIIHVMSLNAGLGFRDALLTVSSGNIKGEIRMYGRSLGEQGIEQAKGIAWALMQ
ncbi:MAG: hypothetical protein QF535_24230, partial [Anaerolineales bacterium]|nr:hypothetical protein [Anaerolineales bacterium]